MLLITVGVFNQCCFLKMDLVLKAFILSYLNASIGVAITIGLPIAMIK
tara:strand:+ start:54 stop:197 length:144 start_codon:yes stop_codon:yes gene_type:complete